MNLMRIGDLGAEQPALLAEDGTVLDLSGVTADIGGAFLASCGIDRVRRRVEERRLPDLAAGAPVGAPLIRPGKVVCVGLNYRDPADDTGAASRERPVVFLKAPYTVVGPDDIALIPRGMVPEPGDVINTGIPAGVALGLPRNPYLRPGDLVKLEITGLGAQPQTFAEA
jgi:2-keto-4-pentenoate hydratase/2-oxohepta-3-ene-1,7-dioic acid hydratase in catechol pathway